jgi:hypothetical protein
MGLFLCYADRRFPGIRAAKNFIPNEKENRKPRMTRIRADDSGQGQFAHPRSSASSAVFVLFELAPQA